MKRILCVGYRKWALNIYRKIAQNYNDGDICIIDSYENYKNFSVREYKPDFILFYGWSWIVDKDIINEYKCLMLHPSKLPKYRGGSPIQNLIMEGIKDSHVCEIMMTSKLDAGPSYAS